MKKVKAISLIECTFSLLLMSICITSILTYYKTSISSYNRSLTTLRANYIRKCIEGYVAAHGFLPYASKSLLGRQDDDCVVGYLPYITLGISSTYAYDGFGRPFIFVVNKNLVLGYQKKQQYLLFPPLLPCSFYYPTVRTWHRLNLYRQVANQKEITNTQSAMYLWDYDKVNELFNINLIKDGKILKLSKIHVYPILDESSLRRKNIITNIEQARQLYPIEDLVAWALISHKTSVDYAKLDSEPIHIKIADYSVVFWQSRFNLAAQIKHPITTTPSYLGFLLSSFVAKKFKY